MSDQPLVSVVIPCRNEEEFIGACLDSIIANDYPKDYLEVMVVDGMSGDGTREIVRSYADRYPFVRLLDNPNTAIPFALNIGIKRAKGEIVMLMGAHARYSTNYVSKCVAAMQKYPEADNVGGVRRTEAINDTVVAKSIAYVVSHPFGGGNAAYHRGSASPRCVDTVWGGCFRREVFEKIGLYNEALIGSEDREFNQRLRDAGGKVLLVPGIECTYYPRKNLLEYCRYMPHWGFWPFYAGKLASRRLVSFRNFMPMAFVVSLLISLGAAGWTSMARYLFGTMVATYGMVCVACTLPLIKRERDLRYVIVAPIIFAMTHVFYGFGSIYAVLKPAGKGRRRSTTDTGGPKIDGAIEFKPRM